MMTPAAFASWRLGVLVPRTQQWVCFGCGHGFAPSLACRALRVNRRLQGYCSTCFDTIVAEAEKKVGV
jgi:hypothetical protein